ncbi:MAG: ABC transporter ATP-binding protein [Pseudomonadales bacterium]
MAEITLEGLRFRYPDNPMDTLEALDLRIASGEAHALLGGSGAGKTTLLNLLSGLQTPTSGCIRFDGRDVTALAPRQRKVAQVFQFPVLYESLSVAAMLAVPLRNHGWSRRDAARRAAEIAARLDLAPLLNARSGDLSLYQKQLVAIGRALVRPDISLVLLDEPLTAVAPAIKWQLRRVLKTAQAELGATMIYVTHDQTEALTFAERISVLHAGRVLQTADPETLYEAPSHEQVAHFIGSPGMNLVPGEITAGRLWLAGHPLGGAPGLTDGACTIGFRPEWARVSAAPAVSPAAAGTSIGGVPVTVDAVRVLGTRLQQPEGLVGIRVGTTHVYTRQPIDVAPGCPGMLHVRPERLLVFRDGARVA